MQCNSLVSSLYLPLSIEWALVWSSQPSWALFAFSRLTIDKSIELVLLGGLLSIVFWAIASNMYVLLTFSFPHFYKSPCCNVFLIEFYKIGIVLFVNRSIYFCHIKHYMGGVLFICSCVEFAIFWSGSWLYNRTIKFNSVCDFSK